MQYWKAQVTILVAISKCMCWCISILLIFLQPEDATVIDAVLSIAVLPSSIRSGFPVPKISWSFVCWCPWWRNYRLMTLLLNPHHFTRPLFIYLLDYAVHIFHEVIKTGHYECFLSEDSRLPMIYLPDCISSTIQAMETPPELFKMRQATMVFPPFTLMKCSI